MNDDADLLFLVIFYVTAFVALYFAAMYVRPMLHQMSVTIGTWLRDTFGRGIGNMIGFAEIIVPLGLLWYFAFWRQRS